MEYVHRRKKMPFIEKEKGKLSHNTPTEAQGGRGCIAPTHS
jgi:hypothetical protein